MGDIVLLSYRYQKVCDENASARVDASRRSLSPRDCTSLAESRRESGMDKHVVMPVDSFIQMGPSGKCQCLVFEPMGPSASYVLKGFPETYSEPGSFEVSARSKMHGLRLRLPLRLRLRSCTRLQALLLFHLHLHLPLEIWEPLR